MNDEIEAAVRNAHDVSLSYLGATPAIRVTNLLVDLLHYCDHTHGLSWARCVEAAQKQHQKEVREAANEKPLPTK